MRRYLTQLMLRQLLTLFALISGLGLAATPAVAAQASVVSVAAAGDAEDCQAVASRPLELARTALSGRFTRQSGEADTTAAWAPSVRIQVDRARE